MKAPRDQESAAKMICLTVVGCVEMLRGTNSQTILLRCKVHNVQLSILHNLVFCTLPWFSRFRTPKNILSVVQPCQVVIGCDGTKSAISRHLALPQPNYAGYSAIRGVATFSEGHNQKSAVRQIWGAGVRAGTYPMNRTDVYWFTVFNSPEGEVFNRRHCFGPLAEPNSLNGC